MISFRKARAALVSIVIFVFLTHPAAFCNDYGGELKVSPVEETTTTWNGQKVVYPKTVSPEVTVVTVDIPPQGETGWHLHHVPVYAYVLAGELMLELEDGKQKLFREGDAIIEVLNTPHNGRNSGKAAVKLIVFYTGIEGSPNTVKVKHK